jgi:hypothetical protein
MTLVVSEISKHGIVMIGDSAITYSNGGIPVGVGDGAAKVQYSEKANVGVAMWGNAVVQGNQMDTWVKDFIESNIDDNEGIESAGQRLTSGLRSELEKENMPWSELDFGIHLAGYINDLPRLWHIHCGHSNEPPHEPRLYHDYPEDQTWTEAYYRALFFPPGGGGTASAHLRNGYTPHYALLFSSMKDYVNSLRQQLGINLPTDSLEGHLNFHKLLVRFVAGALVAAGEHPGVNDNLSSISFDQNGIVSDERFPIIDWLHNPPGEFPSGTHIWL